MWIVAFQWDSTRIVWTYGSKIMRFLRFQPKFGHAVSHCQCSRICPNLPKTAKICPKMKLWNSAKNRDFSIFQKNKISTCRRGTRACFHPLDFQPKNFSFAIFIVKKWPLYVNFSIPPCGKWFFPQCSIPLVGMRFWGHVPNSLRNKNMERHIPYLLFKMIFWPSKLCYPLRT
jgi:hypothetical protein